MWPVIFRVINSLAVQSYILIINELRFTKCNITDNLYIFCSQIFFIKIEGNFYQICFEAYK